MTRSNALQDESQPKTVLPDISFSCLTRSLVNAPVWKNPTRISPCTIESCQATIMHCECSCVEKTTRILSCTFEKFAKQQSCIVHAPAWKNPTRIIPVQLKVAKQQSCIVNAPAWKNPHAFFPCTTESCQATIVQNFPELWK